MILAYPSCSQLSDCWVGLSCKIDIYPPPEVKNGHVQRQRKMSGKKSKQKL